MEATSGRWESPITADVIVEEAVRFSDLRASPMGLFWTELHPKEKGRFALIHWNGGKEVDLVSETSVRSRVHEYGGGSFCLGDKEIFYVSDTDRQVHRLGGEALTHSPNRRYADGTVHGEVQVLVCEEHGDSVENFLVFLKNGEEKTLTSGHDFYMNPTFSPDGKKIAFISWNFPNMPWDGTTLWVADIDGNGNLSNLREVAGGNEISICGAQWSPGGVLHYVSDETGFWNLYREGEALCPMDAEFGAPNWVFAEPTFAFLDEENIACAVTKEGITRLALLERGQFNELALPFTRVENLRFDGEKLYFLGGSPTLSTSIIAWTPTSYEIIKESKKTPVGEEWISLPESITYPSGNGEVGYGFYYPPKNPNHSLANGELPPVIVRAHGGPTGQSEAFLDLSIQFWTSRGFAFLDVNYSGSTGYGRAYFKRLEGTWGIRDVEDCISAASELIDRGLADPKRLYIRGGSAGGYTALAALAFSDVFAAGTSYYGVSDLELLYQDTHKFEAQYTDRLVAPYPEGIDLIRDRSPITHIDKITAPLLLLQGDEDKVVPPNQSEEIFEKLKRKGNDVEYILFEGEGHGFRQAPNIKRALEAELQFYLRNPR